MKIKTCVTCCLVFIFILIVSFIIVLLYSRIEKKTRTTEEEFEDINDEDLLKKFQRSAAYINKLQNIRNAIRHNNERQHIFNKYGNSTVDYNTTVLVVHVHDNKSYVSMFLESISRVIGINGSLLIFAHDYYDDEINSAIRDMPCPRIMQIYYPHSIQLHPNVYPGEDGRFFKDANTFIDSKKRDPVLVHEKLFWWWVANQVFDHVDVLKRYDGYIYFLETEHYLISDSVHMIRMLEELHPTFCSDCQILSLGSRHPKPEMYYPENTHLIVSIWGWSNYSNSGIGFNRTTWNEINSLSRQFCYFKDSSWEYSLRYLATKTPQGHFHMLSSEGPRFFPLTGCGAFKNGTDCDLSSNYHDILKFMAKIDHGRLPRIFKLKFDGTTGSVEPRGQWGDARDVDMCMSFSSREK